MTLGQCDCCGETRALSPCIAYGIETSACAECRGEDGETDPCERCNDSGYIAVHVNSGAYIAPGPVPETARHVVEIECDRCGGPAQRSI